MGAIKHAALLGEELAQAMAEMFVNESEATMSMAVEYAVSLTMTAQERILLGNRITSHAAMSELEAQFDDGHDVEEVGNNE